MEVTEAIEDAEADLASTLEELRVARELVAVLEHDARKIQVELVGLRSYAQRQGLTKRTADPGGDRVVVPILPEIDVSRSAGPDLAVMPRSDAVATVLGAALGPIDRATIHEHFVDHGRFDTIDEISLALSGLKRAGRVEKLGQGLWQLADQAALPAGALTR